MPLAPFSLVIGSVVVWGPLAERSIPLGATCRLGRSHGVAQHAGADAKGPEVTAAAITLRSDQTCMKM